MSFIQSNSTPSLWLSHEKESTHAKQLEQNKKQNKSGYVLDALLLAAAIPHVHIVSSLFIQTQV